MDVFSTGSDKVLLTVFASLIIGFVTAALSIVKLVNDKESNTTNYRQAWVESLRKRFADLISNINSLAWMIVKRSSTLHDLNAENGDGRLDELTGIPLSLHNYNVTKAQEEGANVRALRKEIYQSYAFTQLHFKPNDLSFSRIEQKFDVVVEMLEKLEALREVDNKSDQLVLLEKIYAASREITNYSRDIIKTEWEAVKQGEKAYRATKRWSLLGGGIALAALLLFGLLALVARMKTNDGTSTAASSVINMPTTLTSTTPMAVRPESASSQNGLATDNSVNVVTSLQCENPSPASTPRTIPKGVKRFCP